MHRNDVFLQIIYISVIDICCRQWYNNTYNYMPISNENS